MLNVMKLTIVGARRIRDVERNRRKSRAVSSGSSDDYATVAVAATAGTDCFWSASSTAGTGGAGVVSAAAWPFVSVDVQSREIWPARPHL